MVRVVIAVIVLLIGPAVVTAGADPDQDDHFLALLDAEHVPAVEYIPSLIDSAHRACVHLDEGMSFDQVADLVTDASLPFQRRPQPQEKVRVEVVKFVIAAIEAYCPENRDKLPH